MVLLCDIIFRVDFCDRRQKKIPQLPCRQWWWLWPDSQLIYRHFPRLKKSKVKDLRDGEKGVTDKLRDKSYYSKISRKIAAVYQTFFCLYFQLVQLLSQYAIRETKLLTVDMQRNDTGIHHLSRKLQIEDAYQYLLKAINSEALDSRRVDFMMMTGLALDEDEKLKQKTEEILEAWAQPVNSNRYPRDAKTKDDLVKQWLNMSAEAPCNDEVFQDESNDKQTKKSKSKTTLGLSDGMQEKLSIRRKSAYQTLETSNLEEKLGTRRRSTYHLKSESDDVFQDSKESKTQTKEKKHKSKTLSTSSVEEKLGTRRKSTYQTYQEGKTADSFKTRSQSQKAQKTTTVATKSKSTTWQSSKEPVNNLPSIKVEMHISWYSNTPVTPTVF